MKKFNLDENLDPWLFDGTDEWIERKAVFVIGKNLLSVDNIFSRAFDMKCAGFVDEEIKNALSGKEHICGKRGNVSDFTRASQQRLMKACAAWEPIGQQLFVTLTYPPTWPEDGTVRQKQFKKFRALLRKNFPLFAGCWKLEYQKRGAPHYHLVLQTEKTTINLLLVDARVRELWHLAIGDKAITRVEFPRNEKRAKYYLTKEVGKMVQASKAAREECDKHVEHVGRFWGWHNKAALQFKGQAFTLPSAVALMVREAIQAHVMGGMKADGKLGYRDDGTAYFLNTGEDVQADLLPSFRMYDDGEHAFELICAWVAEKYDLDVFDHLEPILPDR